MKMQTELAHPDFGVVHIRLYDDGEVCIKQLNERLYLTTKQTIELSKLLNNLVTQTKFYNKLGTMLKNVIKAIYNECQINKEDTK